MKPVAASIVASTLICALATRGLAQPVSAHEDAAARAYDAGDLVTALREFQAAYAETRRPDLLYAIGRLYVAMGDCDSAVDHFRRFLASGPGPNATESARAEIAKCEAVRRPTPPDPTPDPTPPPTADPAPPSSSVEPAPAVDGRAPFYTDVLGNVLVGGGVVGGVVAIVLHGKAIDAQCGDPVCAGVTYDEYLDSRDRAQRLRVQAIVAGGIGAALIAGGIARYALRDRDKKVTVGVTPTAGGGAVVLGGEF